MFNNNTFIIAEIGNNHEGSFKVAKELVSKAAEAKVDAVKFQTFKVSEFLNKKNEKFDFYKNLELTELEFFKLFEYAKKKGLFFISTPLDISSAKFLAKFADCIKISSADIDYHPLVEIVAKLKKPTIISTGMSNISRVSAAYKNFLHLKKKNFGLMHCVSSYPADLSEINLNCINTLSKNFNATIGYSDHCLGLDACLAAVSVGAKIIEKHFTLDNNFSNFRDHKLSANPNDLKNLVTKIRSIEYMLGKKKKRLRFSEKKIFMQTRRYMVVKKNVKKNSILNNDNICWVRGKKGILPIKNINQKKIKIKKDKTIHSLNLMFF
jgi:sialic acid synthase SpsE